MGPKSVRNVRNCPRGSNYGQPITDITDSPITDITDNYGHYGQKARLKQWYEVLPR